MYRCPHDLYALSPEQSLLCVRVQVMYTEPAAAALSRAPGSALAQQAGPRPKASDSV